MLCLHLHISHDLDASPLNFQNKIIMIPIMIATHLIPFSIDWFYNEKEKICFINKNVFFTFQKN